LKGKILINPTQNHWNETRTSAATTLSENGLTAANNDFVDWQFVYAVQGFEIIKEIERGNRFPGTTMYYYEVEITSFVGADPDRSVQIAQLHIVVPDLFKISI
jgi:hypothetical protein